MPDRDITIVLSGEAGQGLKTIESIFMAILHASGYDAFLSKEFMSRVRGGNNTTTIRVSSQRVAAYADTIDILFVLGAGAISRLEDRLKPATVIIGEKEHIDTKYIESGYTVFPLDIKNSLKDLGGIIYSNNFINGILSALFSCNADIARSLIRGQFTSKGDDIVAKNITAFERGREAAQQLKITVPLAKQKETHADIVLSGTDAIGIGALAGGCNFIASYPMSPGTGVLVFMAQRAQEYGIVVEQAEDEIAAINMALGAWYAGARGMVTTSGGGFALMTEGMSLAGCIESPLVVHLAQRPGPATGLPTRTEQGDLNLALYAGHGDFPRIIYAPGTLADGIMLAQKAFDVADKFQVPVILLTDQYFLDSIGTTEKPDLTRLPVADQYIETTTDYKRYAITPSGISPRGIPGHGSGLVCVDSDEHTEEGRITEDFDVRVAMVEKRMRKLNTYEDIEPELFGDPDYKILIVGWGSTCEVIREVITRLDRKDIAFAYFKQVYPVPRNAHKLLAQAQVRILVENNATGQFGNLLKMETMLDFHTRILKYNGMPFSVEELEAHVTKALQI